jgi:hypothetical protein
MTASTAHTTASGCSAYKLLKCSTSSITCSHGRDDPNRGTPLWHTFDIRLSIYLLLLFGVSVKMDPSRIMWYQLSMKHTRDNLWCDMLQKRQQPTVGERASENAAATSLQHFLCGLAAGTLAKLGTHPLDVAKKRFQASAKSVPMQWRSAFGCVYDDPANRLCAVLNAPSDR